MPIDRINIEEISEQDLLELIDTAIPEGIRIEYKLTTYGKTDKDKKELLKDVTAFANTHGGHLIIGMDENEGIAISLKGLERIDVDKEICRIEQLLRTGIEPKIIGIKIISIPLTNGNKAIVIRVPRSWNLPHRVCAQNSNRFWIRNTVGVHEASMDELQNLFVFKSDLLNKILDFRMVRIKIITDGKVLRPLFDNGRLIVHIVPLSAFSSQESVDLESVSNIHTYFEPIGTNGMSPRFNFDGFINERSGQNNNGYTQIFRNGIIEATKADIIREYSGKRGIPGLALERYIINTLPKYIEGLNKINVSPPLVIMITFEGVANTYYYVSENEFDREPIDRDILLLPICILEEYGSTNYYHRTLKPALDTLWNTINYKECMYFDKDGNWKGKFRT